MKFIVEIKCTISSIDDIIYTKRIEAECPSKLLEAIAFTNGTGNGVPTLEQLLVQLFEKRIPYIGTNYRITARCE